MERMDAEYVRRAKLGEKDAFGELVDRHRDVVFSICFSRCNNFTDAQDLTQEAFVRAYTYLDQLREPEKFAPWLHRITYAVCARWFRDSKCLTVPFDEIMDAPVQSSPVEDELYRHENRRLLGTALQQLPENQKLAANLHYICGYSYEEIAQITSTGLNTVRKRLQRARSKLRDYLLDRITEDVRAQKPGKALTRRILSGLASFEKEEMFSHLRSIKAVLEYHKERVDWDFLLGASGEAFSIYFNPNWSYQIRFVHSWDVMNSAAAAYGYKGEWYINGNFDEAIDVLDNSLSKNLPVIAPGINPAVSPRGGSESHYWFVVNGIDREKQRLALSGVGERDSIVPYPYRNDGGEKVLQWHGIIRCLDVYPRLMARNPLLTISPDENKHEQAVTVAKSLYKAIDLSKERPLDIPDYESIRVYGGLRALKEWRDAFKRTIAMDLTNYEHPRVSHCGHYGEVIYGLTKRLEVSRRAAASYVHNLAFSEPYLSSTELVEAANRYEAVASMAHKLFELYYDPEEEMSMRKAIWRYPKPQYFFSEEFVKFQSTFFERFCKNPDQRKLGAELLENICIEESAALLALRNIISESAMS